MNKTKNAPVNHKDQLDEAIRRRNLWMKRRDKLVVQIDEIADTLQIKHPSLNTAVFVEQIKSEIASLQKELAITRKEVEQLQQFAQEVYVTKKALKLACEELANEFYTVPVSCKKKEWQSGTGGNILVCSHDCDRCKCYGEYFMEEAKK